MEEEDIDLSALDDGELVEQMHDDLYDGLADEICEGVNILLERGWEPYRVLTEALVEGMRKRMRQRLARWSSERSRAIFTTLARTSSS